MQIEYNCLRGETVQRELWFSLDSEPQGCHETRHGSAGGTTFPFSWISSLQWLFPQPLQTDDLEQIHCIQWCQQSKHKGNLPSSALLQSDENAVALFISLSRIFGVTSEVWWERGRGNTSVGSLGIRVTICCFCRGHYCTDTQSHTHR